MKKINALLCVFIAIIFFSVNNFSQGTPVLRDSTRPQMPDDFTVGEVKGKIVNKPAYLPKPRYPISAKQAGAEGTVRVQIKVDEEGNVTEAMAISGPELLKEASEEAARYTRFVIARDAIGAPIKTEGTLAYSFEIKVAGWSNIGYGLSVLNMLPIANLPLPTFIKKIPIEWTKEREMFDKLKEIQKTQLANIQSPSGNTQGPTVGILGRNQASVTAQWRVPIPEPPSAEQITLAQNLVSAIQSRLENDKLNLWRFNLGIGLSKALRVYRSPSGREDAPKIIKELKANAPDGTSPAVLTQLDNLVVFFAKSYAV